MDDRLEKPRTSIWIVAVTSAALIAAACGSDGENPATGSGPAVATETSGAEEALTQAEHEELRSTAQTIIDSQTAEIGQMEEWEEERFVL